MSYKNLANRRSNDRAYYASHREEIRAKNKRYYSGRRDKILAYARVYRQTHRDKILAYGKAYMLQKKYGLTQMEIDALLALQGGVCAACGTTRWGNRGPVVDHNHQSGEIRGILCNGCNQAAGLLGDDPERAIKLSDYLNKRGHAVASKHNKNVYYPGFDIDRAAQQRDPCYRAICATPPHMG